MPFHLPVLHFSCCCKRSWLIGRNLIFHGIILRTSVGYGTTGFRKHIQYQKKEHIEKGMLYDGFVESQSGWSNHLVLNF